MYELDEYGRMYMVELYDLDRKERQKRAMIYGYARVSTYRQAKDGNSLEAQEKELRKNGAEMIYSDTFTGTLAERPQLDVLMKVISSGDVLIVTKLDRIARNVKQGIELIDTLNKRGVKVNVLNMGVIDNTPTGRLIRNVMLSFAEWERDMILQRTQEGKAIARLNPNWREGRPYKYSAEQTEHALYLLNAYSYTMVERMTGISRSTLRRMKKRSQKEEV